MLTPSGAKLLDFGLAKPAVAPASVATLTAAASQTTPMTQEGTIVGTFQYMSPEQVEGKELDGRSDIFSFGAVLYEMLTGRRAFPGKSQLSVASAILEKEPAPISSVKPMTPPALDHTIRRCLAKETERRWQSAGDLARELEWISESGSQAGVAGRLPAGRRRWEGASWLLAAAFFLMTLAGGTAWWQAINRRPHAMYFHASVPFAANNLAMSQDGRMLAMVAYSGQANNYMLWTYEVGSRRTISLEGTQGASFLPILVAGQQIHRVLRRRQTQEGGGVRRTSPSAVRCAQRAWRHVKPGRPDRVHARVTWRIVPSIFVGRLSG